MKTIYLIILILLFGGVNAQITTIMTEGFEFGDVPPAGWLKIDADGDNQNWNIGNGSTYSHSGNCYARSFSRDNNNAFTPNNWLVTPKIQLNTGVNLLKFWVAGFDPNFKERFKVVLSQGNQDDTTGFTKILYSSTLQNGNWNEITVNLSAFATKEVCLAFVHYNCTDQFYLRLDDISVTSEPDILPPTVVDNSLTVFPAGHNAQINMNITDYSLIQSAILYYKVNGGSTQNISMTGYEDSYTAIIPQQVYGTNVSYQAVVKDVAGNTTTTAAKQITWQNQLWFDWGSSYENVGIGYLISPWRAAADFDFGTEHYKIRKIESAMYQTEQGCSWSIVEFDEIPLENQIGDLSGIINFTGNYSVGVVDVNKNSLVTSKFAVVISTAGNKMQMNTQGPDNHTFIAKRDSSFRLLTSLEGAAEYHGSWHIRVFAEINGTGIEEQEFIPGEIRIANYPNPFNPTTTIKFFNNCTGKINLTVYNYKGEIVRELVNSKMTSGEHSVSFDGNNLSSGVYFYKLTTPVKSLTGRMLLLK